MKESFTFLFLLFVMTAFGQKTVNDSIELARQNKYYSLHIEKLQLPELLKTKEDFYFRLSYHGTKIDIWKDSTNNINGILTKFIFSKEQNTNRKDTLFKKYKIEKANEIYNLINDSKIIEIPNFKEIKNWGNGHDGITYTFEFANKHNYQIKSYWSPKAQDSTITEAQQLIYFCDKINLLSKHDSINESFESELPRGFTYRNGSNWAMVLAKISNSYVYFSYNGNYRLPFGFVFGYSLDKIKKKKINMGISFQIQNNFENNLNFESIVWKRKIFGNDKTYYDSFRVIYEYNKLDYIKTFPKFENIIINYSGNFKNYISYGFSYNRLLADKTYNGFRIGVSKEFESIHLDPYYDIAIFENKITNYKIGFYKSFLIKTDKKSFRIYTNLFYEKTFDFKSFNLSVYIPIKDWTIN